MDSDGELVEGFLESSVHQSKTATGKRRRLALPLVAHVRGVLHPDKGPAWAPAWAAARSELCGGRDDGRPLMLSPRPRRDGRPRPMDASEVTIMLRQTLNELGFSDGYADRYTSRACKATALSWAAKAGLPPGTRRPLGGHVKPGERVPQAYSRDELSAPLRALGRVLADIRGGVFDPDATRSGMLREVATGRTADQGRGSGSLQDLDDASDDV